MLGRCCFAVPCTLHTANKYTRLKEIFVSVQQFFTNLHESPAI